jgi:hypothetical protein
MQRNKLIARRSALLLFQEEDRSERFGHVRADLLEFWAFGCVRRVLLLLRMQDGLVGVLVPVETPEFSCRKEGGVLCKVDQCMERFDRGGYLLLLGWQERRYVLILNGDVGLIEVGSIAVLWGE